MRKRSGFGWLQLGIGVLLILAGILTLFNPRPTLTGLIILYGILAVIMGAADILFFIRTERYTGFAPVISLISGILSVTTGIMLLVYTEAGILILSILFPVWFITHCISRLSHLNSIRFIAGVSIYYFTMIVNIIGLVLALLMLFNPLLSLTAIGIIAAIYLILLGIDSIALSLSDMGL
ncbi:MAG TPA: DUF308 domain-containing protein [Candidatus Ruminococcus avistercoris]|nr:DUF308 domain-containing protein [Candidatus Ruminococcus avistercoris]